MPEPRPPHPEDDDRLAAELLLFVDGGLDADRSAAIEELTAGHPDLAHTVALIRAGRDRLREAAAETEAPFELRRRIDALVDEVDRDAGDLDPVLDRLLDGAETREGGQQRRVDVDDTARETADEAGCQELHETGEHDQVNRPRLEPAGQRLVAPGAVRLVGEREDAGLDPRRLRPPETASGGPAGGHRRYLDLRVAEIVDQRLQVRPVTRDEDCDPKAHAATRSTG